MTLTACSWELGVCMLMCALGCFREHRAERSASSDTLRTQRLSSGLVLASAMFVLMGIMGAHHIVSSWQ